MTYEKLTLDGHLWKSLDSNELYLSSSAGLETTVFAYYLASFEGVRLLETGLSGNA